LNYTRKYSPVLSHLIVVLQGTFVFETDTVSVAPPGKERVSVPLSKCQVARSFQGWENLHLKDERMC